ncbi:ATP-binding cassette subfamily B protein [Pedobacter africanus]|uniref:ATP-binding cassette subfamily B protein n=1 Tax=Pedobacter africanus TaxID=151894 RepID=A0ACC6KTD5_9SPHI|nr:ABC transporter ATP-binding protein [Pedobacter africanus]MDR6782471.1 ATP-binding cassette subfamily B protein [Pedobacter africanus]
MVDSIIRKIKKLKTNLNIKRTLGLVWLAAKGWMILSIIMILAETLLFLGSIYALKVLIDKVARINTLPNSEELIIKHVLIAGVLSVLYAIARAVSAYVTEVQATKVSNYIDEKIHHTAIQMDLYHYESPDYYDILKRAKDAGSERPNIVITTIMEIAKNTLNLFAVGSLFITINWFLLPLLVAFVLPTLFVRIYFSNKQNTWRIKHTPLERKSAYLSNLITSDTSAKEIRSFNLGTYFKDLYQVIRIEVIQQKLNLSYKRTLNETITGSIATMGFFTCIGYIAVGTVRGTTSVGDIALFLIIFPQSFTLIQNVSSGISQLYQNNIFIHSIFELFDLRPQPVLQKNTVPVPEDQDLDLELKEVSFTYPHSSKPALSNINLKIPSGKIIAIVGLNGAGKSTLIKLLSRLYEPNEGEMTLGKTNIREFDLADYRRQISTVFQDFSKYNVSAADNIRFGNIDGEYNEEKMVEASKNAGSHSFISKFSKGYDTMMGRLFEDGHEVSIGQWQKLAIARALYSESRFIILDEATSALDAIAEKELFDSFRKHIGNRAGIIVSHRHSAIKHADYIYVISGGKILQEGTDKQLLEMEGDYANLFNEKTSTE